MLRPLLLTGMSAFLLNTANAQEFVQISTGAGYNQQSFYRLSDDHKTDIPASSWDLAFSAYGNFDAAIHINEGAGSGAGAKPAAELYNSNQTDFSIAIDPSGLGDRLWNDESGWDIGALNTAADPSNPFDYGWGNYNPANHQLEGTRVFVIKLRDAQYKKFKVMSLISGVYTLVFANLDGSDEQTVAIKKSDYQAAGLAFFSFESGSVIAEAPSGAWDLSFCRYVTPLDDGTGNILDYPVTGILSAPGVETVKAEGIDPETVSVNDYLGSFETRLDVIGYDWKAFDFTQGWILPEDLVYFVKTSDDHIWKLRFIDFEGSTTGTGTFEKTDLGVFTSVTPGSSQFKSAQVFPNPVVGQAHLIFTAPDAIAQVPVQLFNAQGQLVWAGQKSVNAGSNAWTLPALQLASGSYFLQVGAGRNSLTLAVQY